MKQPDNKTIKSTSVKTQSEIDKSVQDTSMGDQPRIDSDKTGLNDEFFTEFLAYKSHLVDQVFVDKLMNKIDRFQKIRHLMIALCCLVGVFSLTTVNSLDWLVLPQFTDKSILIEMSNLSMESVSAIVLGAMLALAIWLITAE